MDDTSRKEWLETTNRIMKDKRILVKRWEVTHPDTLVGKLKFIEGGYDEIGSNEYNSIVLAVKSKKTGNVSRYLTTRAVEIDGVSELFRLSFSKKMIRKSKEIVYNKYTGVKYKVTPVARLRYYGYVIYKIEDDMG